MRRSAVASAEAPPAAAETGSKAPEAADKHLARLRQLAAEGKPDEAEDALYDVIDAGARPKASHFAAVISSCARSADLERAERWLFRMQALEVLPDLATFNMLMAVAAEAANPGAAERWLKEAWKAGFEPDVESFRLLLHAIRRSGDTANAEAWFERMMSSGLQPDVSCCSEIIALYAENQNLPKVEEWMAITQESLGLQLDVGAYNAAMAGYIEAGKLEIAEGLMDAMVQEGVRPNARSYTLLIGDGKSFREPAKVERWSERLLQDGMSIDAETYTSVIGAWAAAGDAQRAEEWFSRMVDDGKQTAEALAFLVDALVLSGGAEGAETAQEWVDQALEFGVTLTPAVYAAMASADVYRGDFEQVEARLQQMEADGLEMNEDSLTALLLAYSNAEPQQAQLAEQMFKQQMLRGKIAATRGVLEALRAAVGGARCLALRRELQLSTTLVVSEDSKAKPVSLEDKEGKAFKGRGRDRTWARWRKPKPARKLSWE